MGVYGTDGHVAACVRCIGRKAGLSPVDMFDVVDYSSCGRV